MTGRELMELQATLHGIPAANVRDRADDLIRRVGLTEARDRRVGTYSGGMRRRLDLAMALIHSPEVLFLDEPTTGLDPVSRLTLWEEVRRLRDEGTTVFLTTQYLEEADVLADRVAIISSGKIVAEGTPEYLKSQVGVPHLDVTFVEDNGPVDFERAREVLTNFGDHRPASEGCHLTIALSGGARDVAPVVRALDDAGFVVASLELVQPTLDDVFVEKTGRHLEGAEGNAPAAPGRRRRRRARVRGLSTGGLVAASLALARRALRNAFRRPQFLAPLVVFPSMFLAVNVGGLEAATRLPGFEAGEDGMLDFQLAAAITQSVLLGGVGAGIAVGLEIQLGFFDRLVTAPIPRISIVLGRLISTGAIAVLQVAYFLAIGFIFGADVDSGIPGILLIVLIGTIAGIGFGAFGQALALFAKDPSIVQGIFPLVFVVLFVSSAFFPRALLDPPASWIAEYNPLSYIADGMRNPIIDSIDWEVVLEGIAAATGVTMITVTLAMLALRGRLREA